jgi:hypothetical protein
LKVALAELKPALEGFNSELEGIELMSVALKLI